MEAMDPKKMKPVDILDETWRDGQQSNWGMMMRGGMFDAIAEPLGKSGFKHVSTYAFGLWLKTVARFFQEDPFDIYDMMKKKVQTNCLMVHGEGYHPNFLSPVPGNLSMIKFLNQVLYSATGMLEKSGSGRRWCNVGVADEQDHDLPVIIPMCREMGIKEIMVSVSYYPNPRRTDAYYAGLMAGIKAKWGIEAVMIKDAGGLLTEERVKTLYPALRDALGDDVKISIHTHCNTNNAGQVVTRCMLMGVDEVWTCIPPLAFGSAQISPQNVIHNAEVIGRKVNPLNMDQVDEVTRRLNFIADEEYLYKGELKEYDYSPFKHQLPGGVVGTLKMQLKNLGAPDKFEEVLDEMGIIIKEMGDFISITPYSQWLVSQATLNVLAGERWRDYLDSWVEVALGQWGKYDCGMAYMDQNLKDKFLADSRAKGIKARFDAAVEESKKPYTVQQLKTKYGWPNATDRDFVLNYACGNAEEVKKIKKPYKTYTF